MSVTGIFNSHLIMAAIVARNGLDPAAVDDVVIGCVDQNGEQSATPGRQALLSAGFPTSVPSMTIERKCGSGQQAIDFDDVMLTRGYSGGRAYCQSKLAQILYTADLAERLDGTGVSVNALHPATYMPTKMVHSPISTVAEGVEATRRLIAGDDVGTGRFYNGLRLGHPDAQAADPKARRRLRDLSERLTGVTAR